MLVIRLYIQCIVCDLAATPINVTDDSASNIVKHR